MVKSCCIWAMNWPPRRPPLVASNIHNQPNTCMFKSGCWCWGQSVLSPSDHSQRTRGDRRVRMRSQRPMPDQVRNTDPCPLLPVRSVMVEWGPVKQHVVAIMLCSCWWYTITGSRCRDFSSGYSHDALLYSQTEWSHINTLTPVEPSLTSYYNPWLR